jgi:hypothetical protein
MRRAPTSNYIHTLDTAMIMAADTIFGYIQGLLDGKAFRQTAYALDRASRKPHRRASSAARREMRPSWISASRPSITVVFLL